MLRLSHLLFASLLAFSQGAFPSSDQVKVYKGHHFELPDDLPAQPNDATISYYYNKISTLIYRTDQQYRVDPSTNPYQFQKKLEKSGFIKDEMSRSSALSYLFFDDGSVIYDELPPPDRFESTFNNASYFPSHSVGKSIISYLIGHAICDGYIESIDAPISDWELMEDTLYYGQPLINLLNMKAGDTNVIRSFETTYIKTGRHIHGDGPLLAAVQNPKELKDTKPKKNARFAYSNLTADVLASYLMHRVGQDFDDFIRDFYQNKVRIEFPIYLEMNPVMNRSLSPTTDQRIKEGAARYGIFATRYDFLRIAKAMLDDWQQDTCEGRYLKEIYNRSVSSTKKLSTWNKSDMKYGYPSFGHVSKEFGGQYWLKPLGLEGRQVLVMMGSNGQLIAIDMDNARIVVISAAVEKYYNARKLAYLPLKHGRLNGSRKYTASELTAHHQRTFGSIVDVEVDSKPLIGSKDGCSDPIFASMMGDKCG